jgi:hypothetical protein
MLNPASGGAYAGVWGRNPSAVKIILIESVNSTLISGSIYSYSITTIFIYYKQNI